MRDRIANWIKGNRGAWCSILFLIGIFLGFLMNFLLGGNFNQGIIIGLTLGIVLVVAELFIGGSGVPN